MVGTAGLLGDEPRGIINTAADRAFEGPTLAAMTGSVAPPELFRSASTESNYLDAAEEERILKYLCSHRVNINVRQVYDLVNA